MEKRKIGIVGCGAIGTAIAKALIKDLSGSARLAAVYDTDIKKARRLAGALGKKNIVASSLAALIKASDFVVEAASAKVSAAIAKKAIEQKRDCMIMSVGGLLGNQSIVALAQKRGSALYIPSGAIGGIDCLKAHRLAGIKKVTLTTRKPAQALRNAPYVLQKKIPLENMREEREIFRGSAKKAISAFPQNINVAATLSLAGIGKEKTMVKIIACPDAHANIHEIEIESKAGRTFIRCENTPSADNPKTSYLAILSALATLKQIFMPVKIGT
ncbi:MAG: aspartate dehydrogenase [Omnitrophica WOR_2 bacterium GWF2_43_52]|nr:MAG: aspartate dehydrogenase [Omnitrophica WOR_2 bacterium GWC2_44_8]OGX21424.1 MAG: aspartate dehydrogenase [Omnitrophica WOR_2 bacterium GWF2_43_52]OGX54547.1 MAG: aspartate dehydrogenase [Omnitrophica WOR_2 bacterium RIFOXYC2_FULL_43_9]HAH21946.1 aspartate dehydrogenase [Candidatus Omnitrophota bacterium]HBG62623.1 aspartate dehydrogenase [Candidatus Omnitrophota bacterium]